MKFLQKLAAVGFALIISASGAIAQSPDSDDSTGLPGDNFSLEVALELFKKANTTEQFEKMLNEENNEANNLDLNEDGEADYIRVIEKMEGDVRLFVLQVLVTESENQDVAVIELERTDDGTAVVQIVGDAELYGREKIVEPSQEGTGMMTNYESQRGGPLAMQFPAAEDRIIVNVWGWPVVRYVYASSYSIWISPWHWNRRPIWWKPWRPVGIGIFYPRRIAYRPYYVVAPRHRIIRAQRIYRPIRVTSVTVRTRNQASVGRYRATRSTTTIHTNHGRKVKVSKTKVRRRR